MIEEQKTEGVKTLLGEPKKAIIKLSGPMVVAMLAQTTYNLADGIWVAGLGANALAAVGLFFPFIMVLIGLSSGLGVGGSAAISRRIGERNKMGADNTAIHTILLGMGIGLVVSLPFVPFLGPIFTSMGASGEATTMAADYARILFFGAIFIFFANIGNAILRGEGDAKRAMYALVFSSALNIVLDPIFIYTLDMGIAGAAWATLVSMILAASIFFYWMFVSRDTFVSLHRQNFQPDRAIMREILGVGIPSSVAMLSMSFSVFLLNIIIIQVGGNEGVAVFTTGWRIVSFGTLPLMGIATGVTAVTAAAYGAQDPDKLEVAFMYAVKIGILIEVIAGTIVFVLAPQITSVFTYSEGAKMLTDDIIMFLRYTALFYPTVPLGMLTSALFRGINQGMNALIVTIIRAVVLQVSIAYILGVGFGYGLEGVWIGIVSGNLTAGIAVTFPWGIVSLRRFRQQVESSPLKIDEP